MRSQAGSTIWRKAWSALGIGRAGMGMTACLGTAQSWLLRPNRTISSTFVSYITFIRKKTRQNPCYKFNWSPLSSMPQGRICLHLGLNFCERYKKKGGGHDDTLAISITVLKSSPEQPSQTSQLTLFWVGGWTKWILAGLDGLLNYVMFL